MEMMKEKFGKLLLGEDMSGSGKGVCTTDMDPVLQGYPPGDTSSDLDLVQSG